MKDEKLIENLYNFTYTRSQISCTLCSCTGICAGNDDAAVEVFKKDGWYATDNNAYCPSCNEKRKKNLKRIVKLRTTSYPKMKKVSPKKRKPAHR
jgi:hypothetical protein